MAGRDYFGPLGDTMDISENRQIGRDSLFLMAELRVDGADEENRIKVRNLSAGGMMGEGPVRVSRGEIVFVNLRHLGWTEGTVAWVHQDRFGVAFREEIDPKLARAHGGEAPEADTAPRYLRATLAHRSTPAHLRKI